MASTASLRSRRSAAQLHALQGVERHIRVFDPNCRRKYLIDFSQAFRSYESLVEPGKLPVLLSDTDLLLVGDYHALPASQRFAAALIEQLSAATERPLVIGLETIFSRDQHILEEWVAGEIEARELRGRIRFDLDWGYDWDPFYELLERALKHSHGIYGLDCMPREDLRKIGARDRHAADKIAEIRQQHPEALILVVFGESHLAPNHLPLALRERLPQERQRVVLQNVDALYWHAAGESCERVEAVRVNDEVVCVFNATPLEKYENYRLCLDRWSRGGADEPDLGPTIYNLINSLLNFLGIHLYSPHNSTQPKFLVDMLPEVYSHHTQAALKRLLGRKGFTGRDRKAFRQRVEEQGSAYLPQANTFYVREFQMMHAAEEAARFLHHACRGLPLRVNGHMPHPQAGEDLFYARAVEHTLAYLGSRVLYPARPAVRESDLNDLYDETREDIKQQTSFEYREFGEMLDLVMLHRSFERRSRRGAVPRGIQQGWEYRGDKLEYATRQLGNLLGSDLYDAYLEGRVSRRFLKGAFLSHTDQPGTARETYFELVRRVRPVKKRARGPSSGVRSQ